MGLVSCIRFRQRTKVDLPQPEGPIRAVAWFAGIFRLMLCKVWLVPYQAFRSDTSISTPTSLPLSELRGLLRSVRVRRIRQSARSAPVRLPRPTDAIRHKEKARRRKSAAEEPRSAD